MNEEDKEQIRQILHKLVDEAVDCGIEFCQIDTPVEPDPYQSVLDSWKKYVPTGEKFLQLRWHGK